MCPAILGYCTPDDTIYSNGVMFAMVEIGYSDMHKMMQDGLLALDYAWSHYDELNSRQTVYTLYGPPAYRMGIMAAGHLTPAKERKLSKTTRRKRYLQYELDQNFHVIRIRHMKNYNEVECTYHLFDSNGVIYAQAFVADIQHLYSCHTMALRLDSAGRPMYYAESGKDYLCVDFYEYPEENRVHTTCYLYLPGGKYTSTGQLASWEAPMGAQNSPVTLEFCEEEYTHIDFSTFFI